MRERSPMNRLMSFGLVSLAALGLAGCVSFGAKPPRQLLSLSAAQRVAPGTMRSGSVGGGITVFDPETARALDTVRIPVHVDATSIAYVQDAAWVDSPRHMFQRLLSETIAATGAAIVIDPGQYATDPGRRILGELVEFGIDARSNMATVTYDATLSQAGGGGVKRQRFSASVPVGAKIDATSVGGPLNAAANKVAADVAAWVAAN